MSSILARREARDRQSDQDRARADYVVHLIGMSLGVSADTVWDGRREPAVSRARQMAMYLMCVGFGLSMARVGAAFGRDRTSVSYAVGRVENWRDDPAIDALLLGLEHAVRQAPAARFP